MINLPESGQNAEISISMACLWTKSKKELNLGCQNAIHLCVLPLHSASAMRAQISGECFDTLLQNSKQLTFLRKIKKCINKEIKMEIILYGCTYKSLISIDSSFSKNFCSCIIFGCTYKRLIQTHLLAKIFVVASFLAALTKVWYRLIFSKNFCSCLIFWSTCKC